MFLYHQKSLFKKILVAHRSEVALRIQTTCKALGIPTVAIYTQDDEQLSFVMNADEAFKLSLLGTAGYLNQDEIISIALTAGVDGIHPGYGFLAENAVFAQKVIDAGIHWIGPDPKVIDLMGDKIKARQLVEKLGIPTIPGFYVSQHTVPDIQKTLINKKLYPVLIKNPLSGGGKAMQCVPDEHSFFPALQSIMLESERMQLDASLLLVEKHLNRTRHVEIQIAGDGEKFIHLYERECSVQRRYQKIIEETPCISLSTATLTKMYDCAVAIAQAVNYISVGTVEFIVEEDETFYFLEVNTRLQVEHAVTELVTGIDLVALQIHLAQGGKFDQQVMPPRRNHTIECRIYAEDPVRNFMPSTGFITGLLLPSNVFIRHEHDLFVGMQIRPFYDPMLSKLVVFSGTRQGAINLMLDALKQFQIVGIKTNITLLKAILMSEPFINGTFTTQLLSDKDFMQSLLMYQEPGVGELQEIAQIAQEFMKQVSVNKQSDLSSGASTSLWKVQQWR